MTKILLFALTSMALSVSTDAAVHPAEAALPTGAARIAAGAPFRIAGVGVMMPAAEAEAALRAAGYTMNPHAFDSGQDSFEDLARARSTGARPPAPKQVADRQGWTKGQEHVSVTYQPFPDGARVADVEYVTNAPSPTTAEITAAFRARYGPGKANPFGPLATWCSPAPCGPSSVTLATVKSGASLQVPFAVAKELNEQVEAAARAMSGSRPGSF